MKLKKILLILFLSVVLVIVGCSQDNAESPPANISDGGNESTDITEAAEIAEADINEENNAKIEIEETTEEATEPPLSPYIITSPYADVDWESYGQYKTALHVHSTNSDGNNKLSDMIENHYLKDYDILAITDHDYLTVDWVSARNGLTQQRFDEITAGTDRNGRGMLQIPYANEQSCSEHLNTFFADYTNPGSGASLEKSINTVRGLDGICFINHPGHYTGGRYRGKKGENASANPETVNKYADLFIKYSNCVGMEIISNKDAESSNDRILWDNILMQTVPQGRYVWGFSNDGAHNISEIGFCFNMFVMPENTLDNFKMAMSSGNFYAVSKVSASRRELGNSSVGSGPVPAIKDIVIDNEYNAIITITAENYDKIVWISNGKVVQSGDTIDIAKLTNKVGSYVRANIIGIGGIAFTQPFGVSLR